MSDISDFLDHRKIEQAADEAFLKFDRLWNSMSKADLEDAGNPTLSELFHHGYRAGYEAAIRQFFAK